MSEFALLNLESNDLQFVSIFDTLNDSRFIELYDAQNVPEIKSLDF